MSGDLKLEVQLQRVPAPGYFIPNPAKNPAFKVWRAHSLREGRSLPLSGACLMLGSVVDTGHIAWIKQSSEHK